MVIRDFLVCSKCVFISRKKNFFFARELKILNLRLPVLFFAKGILNFVKTNQQTASDSEDRKLEGTRIFRADEKPTRHALVDTERDASTSIVMEVYYFGICAHVH